MFERDQSSDMPKRRLSMGFHPRPSTGPFQLFFPGMLSFFYSFSDKCLLFVSSSTPLSLFFSSSSSFFSSIIITIVIMHFELSPMVLDGRTPLLAHANIYLKPLNVHLRLFSDRESSPALLKQEAHAIGIPFCFIIIILFIFF